MFTWSNTLFGNDGCSSLYETHGTPKGVEEGGSSGRVLYAMCVCPWPTHAGKGGKATGDSALHQGELDKLEKERRRLCRRVAFSGVSLVFKRGVVCDGEGERGVQYESMRKF